MAGPVVRDGKCTIAVPGDWEEVKTVVDRSQAHSPDGSAEARVQQWPSGKNYPTFISRKDFIVKDSQKQKADLARTFHQDVLDVKVLEDTPTRLRLMRVTKPYAGSGGGTQWSLLAAGDPICSAEVYVPDAPATATSAERNAAQQLHAVAEQIVATFTPAK